MHCGSSRMVSENFHHLIILHLVASPQSPALGRLYQAVLMTETEQQSLLYTCSGPSMLIFNPPNTHSTQNIDQPIGCHPIPDNKQRGEVVFFALSVNRACHHKEVVILEMHCYHLGLATLD